MFLVSSALLSFLFVVVSSDTQCGHDEYYYAKTNKCFFYSTGPLLLYDDARNFCQQNGGDLITIHSQDENNFITGLMQQHRQFMYAWIGLLINYHDAAATPGFSWIDGSVVNYTDFNTVFPIGVNDSNTLISKILDLKWESAEYHVYATPVCQRTYSSIAPTPPAQCPIGSFYSATSNKCFQLNVGPIDWLSAGGNCGNGTLASIHSAAENQLIADQAKSRGYAAYWIGLNHFHDPTGNFTWEDNSPVDYTNWNPGVPASCNNGPKTIVSVNSAKGDWFNCLPYNTLLPFVCEIAPDGPTSLKQDTKNMDAQKIPKHPKDLKMQLQ